MTNGLFVVSELGYWGEECVTPMQILTEAGWELQVATPTGNPPVVDERSVDPEQVGDDIAEQIKTADESDERLNNPIPLARADMGKFDAVVFPGGHGTEWDINQDKHARSLLRQAVETNGKKALVVCHAVGLLAFTRDSDGGFLVDNRNVTGFPNEWEETIVEEEDLMPDGRKLPYWVEEEVLAAGGTWDAELDEGESVTVDGDLITARGPESSRKAAETLLAEM